MRTLHRLCILLCGTLALLSARSQTPAAPSSPTDTVTLSPFEVRTDQDTGYTATSTLAGSRLNTALRDTPASISVFTKQFLDDIGAVNVTEALEYSLNGSRDNTDYTGNSAVGNDLVLQFRGFTGASLGRNYFNWSLSSDSYNVERLDFSRGPNSILFGIAGPGGIINTTTKRARIGSDVSELRVRVGSWDDYRGTLDIGRTLIRGKLAARVNLLYQEKNGWREFEESERLGSALALTYRPFKNTEVRFDGEYGTLDQVISQPFPAQERFYGWRDSGSLISQTFGQAVAGTGANTSFQLVYDPSWGLGAMSLRNSRNSNTGPGAPSLGNNTQSITDERILPRTANISGPGFTGDYDYYNYAFFVEQKVGDLAFEAAFNRQGEKREQYRPQVFNDVAVRVDVNAQLPDGRPNPNVGKFYTDGTLAVNYRDQVRDDFRLTGSYDLNLESRHPWLGRHTFAALWTRRDSYNRDDAVTERNLTPAGNANYPLDLTNGNNVIRRRTYLDFNSGDSAHRGLHNPKQNPINANGVRSGLVRTGDSALDNLTRVDSKMAAVQSRFLKERLILTGGLRNDRQRAWSSTADLNGNGDVNDDRDPVTRLYPRRRRDDKYTYSEGDTRTYGAVFHVTNWVSVFYNNANNFIPQSSRDINENVLGNREGQGQDMGLRFNVLGGKLNASVAYYETAEVNRAVGRDNAFINAMNDIYDTINYTGRRPTNDSQDSQDTEGHGWEVDVTANLTPNWRLAFNGSQTIQVTSNIQPRNGAYVEANRALWQQHAALPLVGGGNDPLTGQPSTVATAIRTIDALYAGFKQSEGQSRRQLREYAGNVFTSYTFRGTDTKLAGLTIGGGANLRGDTVVGYDTTRGNAPILAGSYVIYNAMTGYQWRLSGKKRLRLQVNIDNVLNEEDLIVTDADQFRAYRYIYQTPRRWSVTTTLVF